MNRRTFAILLLLLAACLYAQSSTVYVTAAGKKYHRQTCRTIAESKVNPLERNAAENAGYTACKVCKP